MTRGPELTELSIADAPDAWRALGFYVDEHDNLDIGGVQIHLGVEGRGIRSWSFNNVDATGQIDGLDTPAPRVLRPPPFATHANGATGIDQVIVMTGDFDRTQAAFGRAGIELRRTDQTPEGRVGFKRVGPAILEILQPPNAAPEESGFWGLAVVVVSLEALSERLGQKLGPIRPAKQPGRHIATLEPSAGLSSHIAFLSPEL